MVEMTVNLLCLAVAGEKTTQHSLPTDPDGLGGHARIGGTLALACGKGAGGEWRGKGAVWNGWVDGKRVYLWCVGD